MKGQAKKDELIKTNSVNDIEIDNFIDNYIEFLPDDWRTDLDMKIAMKNAMIMALSFPDRYKTKIN